MISLVFFINKLDSPSEPYHTADGRNTTGHPQCCAWTGPTVVFFSGAMGLDLGIEKAGFEIRLACESDKYCR